MYNFWKVLNTIFLPLTISPSQDEWNVPNAYMFRACLIAAFGGLRKTLHKMNTYKPVKGEEEMHNRISTSVSFISWKEIDAMVCLMITKLNKP